MAWTFDSERPIYTQLLEQIRLSIISGIYPPGSRLPSVRELAIDAAVNPNTMQKALSELEQSGLLYSQRTAGRFVTEDTALIEQIRQTAAQEFLSEFMEKMRQLGYQREDILNWIKQDQILENGGNIV